MNKKIQINEREYRDRLKSLLKDAFNTDLQPLRSLETATQKVRMAEDAWNTRDPQRVALAYTIDSHRAA